MRACGRTSLVWKETKVMQKIVMQIIELNTEEAKAVAGGLRKSGHGDFGGGGFGAGFNGRQPIEKRR
jgi:hypothetical protein